MTVTLKPDVSADRLEIPWSTGVGSNTAKIGGDASTTGKADEALLQAITRAHVWLDLLSAGRHESIEALATAAGVHPKVLRNRIRLAFLSPAVTRAAFAGRRLDEINLAVLNGPISLG